LHGISKTEVQALLGEPSREWATHEGISYCVYKYDGGYKGSSSEASAVLFLDIISVGVTELFVLLDPDTFKPVHEKKQIAVAYDQQSRVVGVFVDFADFEDLPASGNSQERKSIPISGS
jgi:hypothetical protein